MIIIYRIYSIETLRRVGSYILLLNITAVRTFKNKNYEHRRIEFKFLVYYSNSYSIFMVFFCYLRIVSYATILVYNARKQHSTIRLEVPVDLQKRPRSRTSTYPKYISSEMSLVCGMFDQNIPSEKYSCFPFVFFFGFLGLMKTRRVRHIWSKMWAIGMNCCRNLKEQRIDWYRGQFWGLSVKRFLSFGTPNMGKFAYDPINWYNSPN